MSQQIEQTNSSNPSTLTITLVVNGQPYQATVNPKEIFHEALEHALPEGLLVGHRIRISTPAGDEVFPDMFIGESVTHFKTDTFHVEARKLPEPTEEGSQQTWTNYGFDHLAITVADREDAKRFFSEVLGMTIVRDDRHQTVLTTGNTALFIFPAEKAPLSDGCQVAGIILVSWSIIWTRPIIILPIMPDCAANSTAMVQGQSPRISPCSNATNAGRSIATIATATRG